MSLFSMMFLGMAPFGAFFAGASAQRIGAPATVAAGGSVCIIAAAYFARRLPALLAGRGPRRLVRRPGCRSLSDPRSGKPVRYHALACDYDGTLAPEGTILPETRAALQRLRATGRRVLAGDRPPARGPAAGLSRPVRVRRHRFRERRGLQQPRHPHAPAAGAGAAAGLHRPAARAGRDAARPRRRHRGHGAATRARGGRRHPRAGAGAAGDLQQGRRHGAPVRREQGQRSRVRAHGPGPFAPRGGRRRRRRERPRVPGPLRAVGGRGGRGPQPGRGRGHRHPRWRGRRRRAAGRRADCRRSRGC